MPPSLERLWQELGDPRLWTVGLHHYLILSALLFATGLYTILTRKNAVGILMGIELVLNSAGINFVAFCRHAGRDLGGQVFTLFVLLLAAAEAAVALAILMNIYRNNRSVDVDEAALLKG
jgi:NADH-quinone oxidoreductase subunit K